MISWIQKYFQHHFRVIFAVLLAVTIISFIFTIGASPGIGRAERRASSRPFFGRNLAAENEMAVVSRDTQLSSILHQENSNPMFRLGALAVADQLHIPGPTENEFKDFLKTLPLFAGQDGQFDPAAYTRFQSDIRKSNQFPEALVRRVLEDDYRVGRVVALLGGPGYVQSHEVRNQLERFESIWTLGIATVDYKTFAPAVTPSDADLAKYFSDNAARYEIQPQISLRYAEFPSYEFIDKVTATDAEIRAYYDANPARFNKPADKPADGKAAAPAKPADFASVSLQVELAYKLDRATRLATKAASDFTFELYQKKIVPGTPAFYELLASHKITLKDLAPFAHDEPPAELGNSPEAADQAFKLGQDHPYSDAIALSTGSVVLFFKETLPARQPLLTEVKAKVSADYVENEKRKLFVNLGKTLRAQLEARFKAGDTFDKAVAAVSASSPAKIEGKTLAPFTLRQRPQDLDYLVLSTLEALKKGNVSDMVVGADKGLLVYAVDKKSPDLSEANPQYKTFNLQLARATAARNSGEYLREIVETELAKSEPAAATP
jgi:peptidyl-prolyl cis-trans isomerase D